MKKRRFHKKGEGGRGQAMLLTVLALGGAILGATSIAGLLMLYQIRATTDSAHSAQAVFAADAGAEWVQYVYYCQLSTPPCTNYSSVPLPTFSDASVTVQCADESGSSTLCYATTTFTDANGMTYATATTAITKGTSLNSVRAFFLVISTSTVP